jgi:putative ABC transport system permease protein
MTTTLKQLGALLQMSLRGIPQRLGTSIVIVVGTMCVVAVLVSMLSMGSGLREFSNQASRDDRVIVSSKGAQSSIVSNLENTTARTIIDTPKIKKGNDGKPLATALSIVFAEANKKADNLRMNLPFHGADAQYFNVYPEIHLVAGRMFKPALYEVIVSQSRYEMFKNFEIGDKLHLRGVDWTIVGRFESTGTANLSIIGDGDTVRSVYKRNTIQTVIAILESPTAFNSFRATLGTNPTTDVDVKHEKDVLLETFKSLYGLVDFVSYFVAVVMGIGATLAAINVMYAVVDSRKREIATLLAIGFRGGPIVLSVLIESMMLALPGALLGVLIAWLFFNGNTVSPFGVTFHLAVTPLLVVLGILWATVMGILGGIIPAIRAARVPVATALRAS